jgi:SLT domain-containing protein
LKAIKSVGGFVGGLIPGLAEGGIVTKPTLAMIGEGGQSEAVIPLDKLGNMGGNITINVTGGLATSAEIGESVVNALRAYSRSAGPLQLQVA